jgi:hypothetical protein
VRWVVELICGSYITSLENRIKHLESPIQASSLCTPSTRVSGHSSVRRHVSQRRVSLDETDMLPRRRYHHMDHHLLRMLRGVHRSLNALRSIEPVSLYTMQPSILHLVPLKSHLGAMQTLHPTLRALSYHKRQPVKISQSASTL